MYLHFINCIRKCAVIVALCFSTSTAYMCMYIYLCLFLKVVVLQAYKNNSSVAIEAKYVFPLGDMAAGLLRFNMENMSICKFTCILVLFLVCGFEAFINGKHIVGEVKEKEQAHREYRQAISEGHGAYLMDEETPVSTHTHTRTHTHTHTHTHTQRTTHTLNWSA